ncbi:aminoacyl-tRNA hydrolase [Thermovibrio ammonificans]|jgi:PTH1 family peptidyl-tRNA hydrolase|uniref:Peptidyl-tRNA hydrolase n=1 Tax=Thermovibrio ammonificans (strain DSM 15698 / JCM 12110 / HB-1) TaxID=648996 RepID=E8T4D6_THEA1|nr:aminoacyl-tRNA hydrolase [Thermovibrio ammonificans]ADU96271.1 peptidyl-tRNA hydrolase [Thermovibrio ammonificans HB-1]
MVKLVVGLGNPGREYEKTRHNVGWMVLDRLADKLGVSLNREKFKGLYGEYRGENGKVILLKPLTYMNRSGESVSQFLRYFKIAPEEMVVVYDDLDLPLGKLRLKPKGSSGGHRGVESIIRELGTSNFPRLKVGIGRPARKEEVVDYVLSPFGREQWPAIEEAVDRASDCLNLLISGEPLQTVASKCNS